MQRLSAVGHAPNGTGPAALSGHAVEVAGLRKVYRKDRASTEIIRDLDFHVEQGEFVSVIGLSGCGKSTLLKILAGLTPYQAGTVTVLGDPVEGPRRDVGFVFQHLALLPWRTVLDNVLLPAQLLKLPGQEANRHAVECLKMVGLAGYEKYYLREISGGMQQRVALSRVLMTRARLLLLDEPFSALDELTRESVSMLFLDVIERTGASAVLVTHSILEAVLMSDRVLVMPQSPDHPARWIEVAFSRPRTAGMMQEAAFTEAVAEVRAALGMAA